MKKVSLRRGVSEKEEIIRLTKDLEDLNFMVENIKEERNSGLLKI